MKTVILTTLALIAAIAIAQDGDPSDLTNPFVSIPAEGEAAAAPAPAPLPTAPGLPQAFDGTDIATRLKNSPFNRSVNLSDSLVLTGVAYMDGKPMATLLNKETKKTYVVSETPNPDGWTLVSATPTTDIKRMQAKVNVAGEIVTIRHDHDTQQESMKKGEMRPGGPDRGPPGPPGAGGGDKGFRREGRGPSKEDMERFGRLSEGGRDKMRNFMRENGERVMQMSPEDRTNFIRSNFERIEKEDQSSKKK